MRILIGSHLRFIGGRTHRWRQRSVQVWQLSDFLNQSQFFIKHSNQSVRFILYWQKTTSKCYFRACQSGEIWNKKAFFPYLLILYYIKQIHSMLPCVCSVTGSLSHKFASLTKKNNSFARFARAFFGFLHFADVLALSTAWNDMFCSCVDDVSIWWLMFNFASLPLKRLFHFNFRTMRTHFSILMTLNNCEMIAETRSYIFRSRSRCRRRPLCLSSLIDHRGRQNMVRTLVTHSAAPRVPLFCSYHILTSSVIHYWTDARQHGIYFLII